MLNRKVRSWYLQKGSFAIAHRKLHTSSFSVGANRLPPLWSSPCSEPTSFFSFALSTSFQLSTTQRPLSHLFSLPPSLPPSLYIYAYSYAAWRTPLGSYNVNRLLEWGLRVPPSTLASYRKIQNQFHFAGCYCWSQCLSYWEPWLRVCVFLFLFFFPSVLWNFGEIFYFFYGILSVGNEFVLNSSPFVLGYAGLSRTSSSSRIGGADGRFRYSSSYPWSGFCVCWLVRLLAWLDFTIISQLRLSLASSSWSHLTWCCRGGSVYDFVLCYIEIYNLTTSLIESYTTTFGLGHDYF